MVLEDEVERGRRMDALLQGLSGPVVRAALVQMARSPEEDADSVRELVAALAWAAGALDLTLAWLGCHVQSMDLRPLGYSSFTVFVREELDWQPSRQRELARLLRSDLDEVKRAVYQGHLSPTVGAQAPGKVEVEQQEAWIEAALGKGVPDREPDELDRLSREVLFDEEALTVRRARNQVRLLKGHFVPDRACDRVIVDSFARGVPSTDLLQAAREAPPAPDLSPPRWLDHADDRVSRLAGPIETPRDLAHALEMVRRVQAVRSQRRAVLGRLLDQVFFTGVHRDWGHETFEGYVQVELGLCPRNALRLRKLGRALGQLPDLERAVQVGFPLDRAEAIGRLVQTGHQARRWLAIAPRLPKRELVEASHLPLAWDPEKLARGYEARLARAEGLVRTAMKDRRPGGQTKTGGEVRGPRLGTSDPARIRVATHPEDPDERARRLPQYLVVPEGLLEASRWFIEATKLPPQKGCGKMKEKQHFICQNPECRRRSLRNQVHHDVPRSRGGTDDERNLRCLCPSCHLRLLHGGFMDVVRVGDAHVYLFPGRAVVVS